MDTQISRATTRPAPELRWQILDDLTRARAEFGLKDRTLQVLRALLSFLPKGETQRLTVFPSNRTLSERLLGMPESTLRRHLTALRDTGLIARRESPNRKRYRVGTAPDLTFGFDLAPLFAAAAHIRNTAREALWMRERLAGLRARIRARMRNIDEGRRAAINRTLRRKLSEDALTDVLESLPIPLHRPAPPSETDAADVENGRHIQTHTRSESSPNPDDIARSAIEDVAKITDHPLRTERDIGEAGRMAAFAMGLSEAWTIAQHRRGPVWTTMALAHIHRRLNKLHHPGAYLLSLSEKAEKGQFDLIAALGSQWKPKLTAVNLPAHVR